MTCGRTFSVWPIRGKLAASGRLAGLQTGGQAVPDAMGASRLSHRRAGDRLDLQKGETHGNASSCKGQAPSRPGFEQRQVPNPRWFTCPAVRGRGVDRVSWKAWIG